MQIAHPTVYFQSKMHSDSAATLAVPTNMQQMLNSLGLSFRDRAIITLRFGLDGRGERSAQEIGQHLGISGERVRVLANKTIWKIEKHTQLNPLFVKKILRQQPRPNTDG